MIPEETVHVIARFQALSGRSESLKTLLESLIEPTRAEPGCLDYVLWQEREDPSRFVLIERWRTQSDLDQHLETPHLTHAKERFDDLLESPLSLTHYRCLA